MKHSVAIADFRFIAMAALGLACAAPLSATQHVASSAVVAAPDTPPAFGAPAAPAATAAAGESFVTLAPVRLADASWDQRRIRFRDAAAAALADPGFLQYAIAGVALIFLAAFARRRRRRRIGWGVLPDRHGRA